MEAFLELDRDRNVGFSGEGPIPRRRVKEYVEDFHFEPEQVVALFHHVKEMDAALSKLRKAKADENKPPERRRVKAPKHRR